ncbi:transposase [Streptomyces jumonjinensis]|uniref:transposase n=1 Tax=Streptomyces jumonjinensis TaxID=1945 RepID=UPI0037989229
MISRGDLTDVEWAVLEPLLPATNNRCGRWRDHRQVINGILWDRRCPEVQRNGPPRSTGPRWR